MIIDVKSPSIINEPYEQLEMGVLIGLVGDIKGRIIIDGTPEKFSSLGSAMFGMPLEGAIFGIFYRGTW